MLSDKQLGVSMAQKGQSTKIPDGHARKFKINKEFDAINACGKSAKLML